ncbi:hypothetical protein [Hydrocarboniclastica marina]|uniref:Uncharacterized protein n=1 Tax=Hydrocarboniclastica marina TaxID=2259620 RepID=A0A4P7XIX2_9ALTE|nr:hypothetical protein [Hydrocarboniclastica marina]QCF26494.1 hypothetical protein soil367_11405 [Hydrocarboniclastica marina]
MEINDILGAPFTFKKRKNYTPCDTRPLWKSCSIVLALGITGNRYSASLTKIHVANWIIKKEEHLSFFVEWAGKDDRKRPDVRLEPAVDRVINLLVSNEIVDKNKGKIVLTRIGTDLFHELNSENIYSVEKNSLSKAKRYLSEAAVKRLFEGV